MKKVKANKQMQDVYNRYVRSSKITLNDCYVNYSEAKLLAYNDCRALYFYLHGRNFRIIGYARLTFSVGFEFTDSKTGELCFAYITRDYSRYCVIPREWVYEWFE